MATLFLVTPSWAALLNQQEVTLADDLLFTDAKPCGRCHNNLVATNEAGGEEDISFVHHWERSMMRFSFLDPFWRAKVRGESLRLPSLTGAIEKKCSRCHAPMANEQAVTDGAEVIIFGADGMASTTSTYHALAMEGVGCTLCHQVSGEGLLSDSGGLAGSSINSGYFSISDERVAYSKYLPHYSRTMERSTGYLPSQAAHLHDSAFCAVCHDLYTDYYDENGTQQNEPDNLFPEQTPYQEWLASSFSSGPDARRCQDCHMAVHPAARIASRPMQTVLRPDVHAHTFLTENTMVLEMIESIAEEDGLDIPDLGDSVSDGQAYLGAAGAISIETVELDGKELVVTVKVSNECGHKLPTSIPVRRVFIHFAVYKVKEGDSRRQIVFSSGDTDDEGRIIGVDDSSQQGGYEPHYDEITAEDEVQVYEGVMGTTEDEVTYTLLRAAHFLKDNRILPRGWNDASAPLDIMPKGQALYDGNFGDGEDLVTYRVNLNGFKSGQRFAIEAELKDQTLSYPMVHDLGPLREDDDTGTIARFLDEYEHHKVHFELIDSAVQTVALQASAK